MSLTIDAPVGNLTDRVVVQADIPVAYTYDVGAAYNVSSVTLTVHYLNGIDGDTIILPTTPNGSYTTTIPLSSVAATAFGIRMNLLALAIDIAMPDLNLVADTGVGFIVLPIGWKPYVPGTGGGADDLFWGYQPPSDAPPSGPPGNPPPTYPEEPWNGGSADRPLPDVAI